MRHSGVKLVMLGPLGKDIANRWKWLAMGTRLDWSKFDSACPLIGGHKICNGDGKKLWVVTKKRLLNLNLFPWNINCKLYPKIIMTQKSKRIQKSQKLERLVYSLTKRNQKHQNNTTIGYWTEPYLLSHNCNKYY